MLRLQIARFGYDNRISANATANPTVPYGYLNRFTEDSMDVGPASGVPTTFRPGLDEFVFSFRCAPTEEIAWSLTDPAATRARSTSWTCRSVARRSNSSCRLPPTARRGF